MRRFLCWPFLLLALFFVGAIVALAQPYLLLRAYPVVLNESASLKQVIQAGAYDTASPEVTAENFQTTITAGSREIVLKQYNRPMKTKEVRKRLEKDGLAPVTLEWLAAFGAAYPDVQRHYQVVCLGSVWVQKSLYKERGTNKEVERQDAPNQIAFLRGSVNERSLGICLEDNTWNEKTVFACVKNP